MYIYVNMYIAPAEEAQMYLSLGCNCRCENAVLQPLGEAGQEHIGD